MKYRHIITGEIRQLDKEAFFERVMKDRDPASADTRSYLNQLMALALKPGCEALVLFEDVAPDSQKLGHRAVMVLKPGSDLHWGNLENASLGELPNDQKLPVALWRVV